MPSMYCQDSKDSPSTQMQQPLASASSDYNNDPWIESGDIRDQSDQSHVPVGLEIGPMGEGEPVARIPPDESRNSSEQAKQAETPPPTEDIGHLITFTSLEPVFTIGHFGDIFEGTHQTMGKVALKRPRIGSSDLDNQKHTIRRFEREGINWREFDHPHILKFLGTFKRENHIYLVSPFIDNGTLLAYVKRHPYTNRVRLLCETANAIVYLHEKGVVHGDIKASNILIDNTVHALLCDFGLTKGPQSTTSTAMKGAGTVRWQGSELWDNAPKTFQSDVYAFAMTITEVLTGAPPFPDLSDTAFMKAMIAKEIRPAKSPMESGGISYENAWEVAEACWKQEPEARISISEAFRRLQEDASLVSVESAVVG